MPRLFVVAAVMCAAGVVHADASTPSPPDAGAALYAPSAPLPAGFEALRRADCDGKPGYLDGDYEPPRCLPLPAGFVGEWRRASSMRGAAARVRVTVDDEPRAAARPTLRRWKHGLRPGALRLWTTQAGEYAAEKAESFSCRECDPVWRVDRVHSDGAHRLHVEVTVYGHPRGDEAAELRLAFVNGPLGPAR